MVAVLNKKANIATRDIGLGDLEQIEEEVIAALQNPSTLEEIAQNSYEHANGFVKLTLRAINGMKFRLHIFKVNAPADENIHNHRWDFTSKILCGCLPMYLFEIDESGNSHHLHLYRRLGMAYTINKISKIGIIELEPLFLEAGTEYFMPKSLHHKIGKVEQLTITYMVTESTESQTCDLINEEDKSENGVEIQEDPLSVEGTRANLELILSEIDKLKMVVA